jgi:uncharacterized membrane protein
MNDKVRRWRVGMKLRYDYVGTVVAVAFFCLSLTPSLLPRGWLLQGLISGITSAIGYGLGVLMLWVLRWILGRPDWGHGGGRAWGLLGLAGGAATIFFLIKGAVWQQEIHHLMGLEAPPEASILGTLLVALVLAVALIGLGRLLRRMARWLTRVIGRWLPVVVARLVAVVLVTLIAFGVLHGVLLDRILTATDNAFKTINGETDAGITATTDPLRSGGPGSLVSWDSLGNQGRSFIGGGPSEEQVKQFAGRTAQRPVRVYVGLDSAPSATERAALAVRELQRTGAFDRKVLVVITTTGTGWVNAAAADPIEYMYGGDTAMVATQYSYLPSWLSFLVDHERAWEAGRELFDQVYAAWSALPERRRPILVAFGESLGSFGAESAFSGAEDMAARTQGMLLVGPPNSNTLWREYVADRDPGSTEILPTYQQGATIRFADDPAQLDQPAGPWGPTRVAYLQHASDPIVWWSPRLILHRPDWLNEPRGPDVLPTMRWFPFVTFWQVTADMAFSTGVPPGHGHNYGAEAVPAWARIAPPPGWTPQQTTDLTKIIAGYE